MVGGIVKKENSATRGTSAIARIDRANWGSVASRRANPGASSTYPHMGLGPYANNRPGRRSGASDPANTDQLPESVRNCLEQERSNVSRLDIICGDININYLSPSTSGQPSIVLRDLDEVMRDYILSSLGLSGVANTNFSYNRVRVHFPPCPTAASTPDVSATRSCPTKSSASALPAAAPGSSAPEPDFKPSHESVSKTASKAVSKPAPKAVSKAAPEPTSTASASAQDSPAPGKQKSAPSKRQRVASMTSSRRKARKTQ